MAAGISGRRHCVELQREDSYKSHFPRVLLAFLNAMTIVIGVTTLIPAPSPFSLHPPTSIFHQ